MYSIFYSCNYQSSHQSAGSASNNVNADDVLVTVFKQQAPCISTSEVESTSESGSDTEAYDKTPPDKTPQTKPPHHHKTPYKTPQTQTTTAKPPRINPRSPTKHTQGQKPGKI